MNGGVCKYCRGSGEREIGSFGNDGAWNFEGYGPCDNCDGSGITHDYIEIEKGDEEESPGVSPKTQVNDDE
jgi:hypothetical protein